MRNIAVLLVLTVCLPLQGQEAGVYSLQLIAKDNNPQGYAASLSPRSLERRAKQNISLEESDLPVSQAYRTTIAEKGIAIKGSSKWFNRLLVEVSNQEDYQWLVDLPFVSQVQLLQKTQTKSSTSISDEKFAEEELLYDYGDAEGQTQLLNGDFLHFNGFTGEGMIIALMDAGFENVNKMAAFNPLFRRGRLLDRYNFVLGGEDVYQSSTHGTRVFSIIAGVVHNDTVNYTGTAPSAHYCLYSSEEGGRETPLEMFNWLMAAERADSIGADVLSTSLGYTEFDDIEDNYVYADMDGNTTIITQAADMAAQKGMLVINSAGNSGDNPWTHIVAPADGDSVLAVGAIDNDLVLADFSSRGPSSDGRVKPDVVAVGRGTALVNVLDNIANQDGTSFSCPIISGLAACLWQAVPDKTNMEVLQAIRESSHQYSTPDSLMGYGIPDFAKAYELLTEKNLFDQAAEIRFRLFPNPSSAETYLSVFSEASGPLEVSVFNSAGVEEFYTRATLDGSGIQNIPLETLDQSAPGVYFVRCKFADGETQTFPLVRQ